MHAATVHAADWWARPRGDTAAQWIANYQKSLHLRHRVAISEIVGELQPKTLLEIGCHCGPNLMRLATDHDGLKVCGLDASSEAILAGKAWARQYPALESRIELAVGRFPQATEKFPDGAFDVVLACYTLAYIAPQDLDAALYEVGRLAKHAVILAEPQRTDGTDADIKQSVTGYTEWQHNYQQARRWTNTLRNHKARFVPVVPPVDALNAILVLES